MPGAEIWAKASRQMVAAKRGLTHSPGRMFRTQAEFLSHSAQRALVAVALALIWAAWPAGAAPELTSTGAAVATGTELLETSIMVQKRVPPVGASGVGRFVPVERLDAGEEAYYTIRVHNPGKAPASDVQVTKRMPDGMQYIESSATGPDCEVQFSSDGGETFHARAADGQYTHLRWILRKPLPPGATALLRFRATFH